MSALYLALCLVLGMWPGKRSSDSSEGYVAGDRSLGLLLMYFITGATIFSAFAFLGLPGWAYSRGAAAFYILGYGALGFVPYYFIGPRAARVGRKYGFVTQGEMMATRFSMPAMAGVMAVISVVAFVPYLALQMQGAGYVVETVTGGDVPSWVGAGVVYAVVLIYVLKSGVLGVGWTNTFQGLFMMALAWGLGLYLPSTLYGGVGPLFQRIASERPEVLLAPGLTGTGTAWTWGEYSSAVVISIVGFSMWPHLFMKAFTAKNDDTIRRTVILFPTFQIFLVPLFLIGFCGVFFTPGPARADQILPHILMNTEIPSIIVGLFCAGALAASMSSGDAMAHAAASIAVRDGLITAGKRKLSNHAERTLIRWLLFAVIGSAYLVAVTYKGSLVFLLLTTYGAVVQFAPGVIACLYSERARGGPVLTAMIAGALVTTYFILFPEQRLWLVHPGAYGLAVNVLLLLAMLTRRREPPDAVRSFLATAREEG